jgi:hypothetical protein
LQGGLGLSPSAAGFYQTPLAVSTALGALIGTQTFARTQRMKAIMLWGASCTLIGTVLLLPVDGKTNVLWLSMILALAGWGVGFILPMLTLLVQSIIQRNRMGVATSTIQFLRLIGSTIGTAVVASSVNVLFGRRMQANFTPATDPRIVEAFHNPQARKPLLTLPRRRNCKRCSVNLAQRRQHKCNISPRWLKALSSAVCGWAM